MVVGTSCVAIPMVLNGAIGAKLHVPFSVITSKFLMSFSFRLRLKPNIVHEGLHTRRTS